MKPNGWAARLKRVSPDVTPYPPLTDLLTGRNVVGYLTLSLCLYPDFGRHIRETPVEWPVPDGAGHSSLKLVSTGGST